MLNSRFLRSTAALMLREMSTSYGKHPGGFLWAFIEPVAAITLLTLVFSIVFRAPALGDSFALFYATGYLPFMLYTDISTKVAQSLRYSKQLLMYPVVSFIDALLARFILTTLVHVVVITVVISSIIFLNQSNQTIDYPVIINTIFLSSILGFGIGTLNAYLSLRYPVWERIWAVLNRPAFIVSGIFFLLESVPEPFRSILWYNPLIHLTGLMRRGFYPTYDATFVSLYYIYVIAGVVSVLGLVLLSRNHRILLNSI